LNEDIVKELVGDARAIAELEKEWEQLTEDRLALRQIFPSGESKVCVIMSTVLSNFFLLYKSAFVSCSILVNFWSIFT